MIKISENTKAALAKKRAAEVQLGAPRKSADANRAGTTPQSQRSLQSGCRAVTKDLVQHRS